MKLLITFTCLVAVAVALPVLPQEKDAKDTPVADLVGAEQFYGGYGGGYSKENYGSSYENYGNLGGYGGYGNYGNYGGYDSYDSYGNLGFGR